MKTSRKYLSAQGLLSVVHAQFNKIEPLRDLAPRSNPITQTDCLMSGLAVFGLKFPSLLKFDAVFVKGAAIPANSLKTYNLMF